MKRLSLLLLCGAALLLLGSGRRQPSWDSPYTPSRLEWLALQCNVNHRQRYEFVHSSFLAVPPNKIEAIIKFSDKAKEANAQLRKGVADAAKEYVQDTAKAMGWIEPVEVEALEVFH